MRKWNFELSMKNLITNTWLVLIISDHLKYLHFTMWIKYFYLSIYLQRKIYILEMRNCPFQEISTQNWRCWNFIKIITTLLLMIRYLFFCCGWKSGEKLILFTIDELYFYSVCSLSNTFWIHKTVHIEGKPLEIPEVVGKLTTSLSFLCLS